MRKLLCSIFIFLLTFGFLTFALPTQAGEPVESLVQDGFDEYTNGPVVGQGNWVSYVNGQNFVVQDRIFKGEKALYNNAHADSVVTKQALNPLSDGRQGVYVRTENRSNWGFYLDGNAQFRVSKGSWAGGTDIFAAVTFKRDGNVAYYDVVNNVYRNFATYNDNEWTLLEIEWRSSDKKARYRVRSVNSEIVNETVTDWLTFSGASSFANFDNVGFDFLRGGSGGAYFEHLH